MDDALLIYGANGATGHRLAELALGKGLTPIVAGRSADQITALASRLGCEGRVAEIEELPDILAGVGTVVSCVAPYAMSGRAVVQAALEAGANYLDFTGETDFVRWMFDSCDDVARRQGATLVPSAGLGLCAGVGARVAVDALPTPVERITVGYRPRGMRSSRGTAQSMVEVLAGGAVVVEPGGIRVVAPGSRLRRTPLGLGARFPLTEPIALHTIWPRAEISGYMVPPGAPVLTPVAAAMMAMAYLGGTVSRRALRWISRQAVPGERPGGGFRISVRAEADGAYRDVVIDLDDVYEVTSRAGLEVAQALRAGTQPGVRASGSVVAEEPAAIAARIGVRLARAD